MDIRGAYNLLGVIAMVYLLLLGLAVVSYVLESLALYQLAKRRGIRNYGFAWVPVGSTWILNALGDQYEGIRTGRKQSLRWWALGIAGCTVVLVIAFCVIMFATLIPLAVYDDRLPPEQISGLMSSMAAFFLIYMLVFVALIALTVLNSISLYRVYRSTKPDCAVVFTVLSIVVSVTTPFFLFVCRKYDAPIEIVRDPIPPQYLHNMQQPTEQEKPLVEEKTEQAPTADETPITEVPIADEKPTAEQTPSTDETPTEDTSEPTE